MDALVEALRDLFHSLREYPADWSDDHLAEVGNLAAAVKGCADTERLTRALGLPDETLDEPVK